MCVCVDVYTNTSIHAKTGILLSFNGRHIFSDGLIAIDILPYTLLFCHRQIYTVTKCEINQKDMRKVFVTEPFWDSSNI